VISNTSATPIAGTFANLPDGAILTVNGNNFQANYEGGDDLTLTVVPLVVVGGADPGRFCATWHPPAGSSPRLQQEAPKARKAGPNALSQTVLARGK